MVEPTEHYTPKAAVVIFRNGKADKTYCEMHEISNGIIGSGKPMTPDFASSLGHSLVKESMSLPGGFVPAGLIHIGWQTDKPILTWHTPAQTNMLRYRPNLGIPNGRMQCPPMIWRYHEANSELSVYAVEPGIHRPKTKLYHAPFHNIYKDQKVCLGDGGWKHIRKNQPFATIMTKCMEAFWGTIFTELHHESGVVGNMSTLHRQLIKSKKPFPLDKLVSCGKTLGDIVKHTVDDDDNDIDIDDNDL